MFEIYLVINWCIFHIPWGKQTLQDPFFGFAGVLVVAIRWNGKEKECCSCLFWWAFGQNPLPKGCERSQQSHY